MEKIIPTTIKTKVTAFSSEVVHTQFYMWIESQISYLCTLVINSVTFFCLHTMQLLRFSLSCKILPCGYPTWQRKWRSCALPRSISQFCFPNTYATNYLGAWHQLQRHINFGELGEHGGVFAQKLNMLLGWTGLQPLSKGRTSYKKRMRTITIMLAMFAACCEHLFLEGLVGVKGYPAAPFTSGVFFAFLMFARRNNQSWLHG